MSENGNKLLIGAITFLIIFMGYLYFSSSRTGPVFNFFPKSSSQEKANVPVNGSLATAGTAEKFAYLSKNGNSSCSASFRDSISTLPDSSRLQGSCCSPMSLHRYSEQVDGLKKYSDITEIPQDPYDIEAGLAKKLMGYYDLQLSPEEQKAYNYAMENSDEKGPCCCKCWRWNAYGGLGKYLIRNYKFTGEQLTELWNLSDGCGGDEEHHHT